MTKAYWVAQMDVTDPAAYDRYRAANGAAFAKYGARFVIRGGAQEVKEGHSRARTVVIEFASLEAARACYESPEYQAAKALRAGASEGHLIIVPGWEG
jgi:uncharacterized protein (DUF1330 family)